MFCPKCGQEASEDFMFCPKCGSRLDGKKNCRSCGKDISEDFDFCPFCGVNQEQISFSAQALQPQRAPIQQPQYVAPSPTARAPQTAPVPRVPKKPFNVRETANSDIVFLIKNAALAFLMLFVFMFSFFNAITIDMASMGLDMEVKQSSVKLIGAMFAGGYTQKQYDEIYEEFVDKTRPLLNESDPDERMEKLEKIMRKMNLYRLMLTDDNIEKPLGFDFYNEYTAPATRFELTVSGLFLLFQILVSFALCVMLGISTLLRLLAINSKNQNYASVLTMLSRLTNIGCLLSFAIALITAFTFIPYKMTDVGVAAVMPLVMCPICIMIASAHKLILKPDINIRSIFARAATILTAFLLLIFFTFMPLNNVQATISGWSERSYKSGLTPYYYTSAYAVDAENYDINYPDEELTFEDFYEDLVFLKEMGDLSDIEFSQELLVRLNDPIFIDIYPPMAVLAGFMPVIYLLAALMLLAVIMINIYNIDKDEVSKLHIPLTSFIFLLIAASSVISIILNMCVNESLSVIEHNRASLDNYLKLKLGVGAVFPIIWGLITLAAAVGASVITHKKVSRLAPSPAAVQTEPDAVQSSPDAVQSSPDAVQPSPDAVQTEPAAAQTEPDAVQADTQAEETTAKA